jgi:hypothetical protein
MIVRGLAKTMSQCISSVVPTPMAMPSSEATSGFSLRTSALRKRTTGVSVMPTCPHIAGNRRCRCPR